MWQRIYAHSLMPSRLSVYRALLEVALASRYEVHSVQSFWRAVRAGALDGQRKYLVLRHDVDTGVSAARNMWSVEQAVGARATYYFRLVTADVALMRGIERSGSEASYHYEELAAIVKERGLLSAKQAEQVIPEAQERFRRNLARLREKTGLAMTTVASHGDFVNVRLRLSNWHLLRDPALRQELGIELEAYDEAMMQYVTSRAADSRYPGLWKQGDPAEAVWRGDEVVYVLTHPEHWEAHPREHLRGDLGRLVDGLRYSLCAYTARGRLRAAGPREAQH